VEDAFRVGRVQCVRNLNGQRQNQLGFHRSTSDAVLQRRAIQELHDDEVLTLALVNLEDHTNIGNGSGQKRPWLRVEIGSGLAGLWLRLRAGT